ncbi:hypothetical protein [Saccharopolyspora gloriosae]|uniref:hypothetical protein n=1 Tax=Saccharopolyspora gloriosae TaxID=455344 RepID=UPI001FB67845|nr:hypothetical protein [Saccharopolyspora gloriosae]
MTDTYLKLQGVGVTAQCLGPVMTGVAGSIRPFGPETTTDSGRNWRRCNRNRSPRRSRRTGSWCRPTDNVRPHLRSRAQDRDAYSADRTAASED